MKCVETGTNVGTGRFQWFDLRYMLLVVLQPFHGKVPQLPRQFCEKKNKQKKISWGR